MKVILGGKSLVIPSPKAFLKNSLKTMLKLYSTFIVVSGAELGILKSCLLECNMTKRVLNDPRMLVYVIPSICEVYAVGLFRHCL